LWSLTDFYRATILSFYNGALTYILHATATRSLPQSESSLKPARLLIALDLTYELLLASRPETSSRDHRKARSHEMATAPGELFPNLPPELRNEVYNYLSIPWTKSAASIFGLPLKLKTFECKHTTVEICPVHYGSTGFLALQTYQFPEAREYGSWLLNNAMELRIGVTFHGRVNTFVQQDWNKKMEAHLRKLAKLHPWLRKVSKYDVQIFWSPVDGVLRSKKNKRTTGQISKDLATALTALAGANVKREKGELNLKLCLDHKFAAETLISGTRFGFDEFLSSPGTNMDSFKRQTREVWKEPHMKLVEQKAGARFLLISPAQSEERNLMTVEDSLVRWTVGIAGHLVVRKHIIDGRVTGSVAAREQKGAAADHIAISLAGECL
jgi:hypothetical protein